MHGDASRVVGPNPRFVLAMAQHRRGQKEEARKTLAAAILAFDWSAVQADNPGTWMCHVLRREAETMILPDLPAFLEGNHQPRDNDERLALLGVCQLQGRHLAAARLYADAFAADPPLAEDLKTESRYHAVRCAALAGCGCGADGANLSEAERTRWRRQACAWLQADFAAWTKVSDNVQVQRALRGWQQAADLAGVRDPEALAKLPQDEREAWTKLWSDVADRLNKSSGRE